MKYGLILGGGGVVGVAWELGVLEGLRQAIGFDPLTAEVIVGTSAGAPVGALLASGRDLATLIELQRQGGEDQVVRSVPDADAGPAPSTTVVPAEIMRLITSAGAGTAETGAAIGKLALDAKVDLPEEFFVAYFQGLLQTDIWPSLDYRSTTTDCLTGETVLWSKSSGVDLARAVASSCSVPGHFPTVEIKGRRYTDGPRAPFCADLVAEKDLQALIFIGPQILLPRGGRTVPEIDQLVATGLHAVQITGGLELEAMAVDLMDPRGRARAVDIGVSDGRDHGDRVARALGLG